MIRHLALRAACAIGLLLLLLAPLACFQPPDAPLTPYSDDSGWLPDADEPWTPDLAGLDIETGLDAVGFRLRLDRGDDNRPPLDISSVGRTWTFQLGLDVDRDDASGDAWGSEFLVAPGPEGRAWLLRHDGSTWQRAASAPLEAAGDQLSFSLPAAALGERDGRLDYLLDLFAIEAGDPGAGMELVARHTGTNQVDAITHLQVPVITRLRARARGGALRMRGQVAARGPRSGFRYDPYAADGWQLQLFLNTDQAATGYWLGYDYLVRGSEWSDGCFVVRRIEPGEQYPGGWGPESGRCEFHQRAHGFLMMLPTSALGGDDGMLDYALDTYATVPCTDCAGGVVAEYCATYFGSSVRRGRPVEEMPGRPAGIRLARVLPPPPGSAARAGTGHPRSAGFLTSRPDHGR
jgi:hypothetical protein